MLPSFRYDLLFVNQFLTATLLAELYVVERKKRRFKLVATFFAFNIIFIRCYHFDP